MTSASISSEPVPQIDLPTPQETGLPERRPPNLAENGWLHGRSPANQQIIIMHQGALRQVVEHSHSNRHVELGGALLGQVYRYQNQIYVEIMAALPAVSGSHGPIHFTFNADSWTQLQRDRAEQYPKLDIVGWFHTHPGLGVFYSGDDVVVHSAAFTLPWHVGLVVDPIRNEASFFGWIKGQLAPSAGFYELLDTPEPVVDWKMVQTSVWQETYEEHLAAEQGLEPHPNRAAADWQPAPQRWGLIVGALGLILSFFLLVGWVVPLTQQVNQLEALTLTLADQTLTENVAACPDSNLRILSPAVGSSVRMGSEVDVVGTAVHPDTYRYRVEIRPLGADLWSLVDDKRADTALGTIATWDTTLHQPAAYEMRLTAVDRNNIRLTNSALCLITLEVKP
jgi:proteasome lid subunit RPN8/RPN11